MAYRVVSRFYTHSPISDQIGEAYVLFSDNSEEETKFEIGQFVSLAHVPDKPSCRSCRSEVDAHDIYCRQCGCLKPWNKTEVKS